MKIKNFFRQVFCRHKLWRLLSDYEDEDFVFECIRCGKIEDLSKRNWIGMKLTKKKKNAEPRDVG